jgi:hypothetical protein
MWLNLQLQQLHEAAETSAKAFLPVAYATTQLVSNLIPLICIEPHSAHRCISLLRQLVPSDPHTCHKHTMDTQGGGVTQTWTHTVAKAAKALIQIKLGGLSPDSV